MLGVISRLRGAHLLSFWLFLFFSFGIIVGNCISSFWLFVVLSFSALICIIIFYKKNNIFLSDIFIFLLFLSLGALWIISFSQHKIDSFLRKENIFVIKVVSLPQEGSSRNTFFGQIKGVGDVSLKYKVKVYDYTHTMEYLCSYRVEGSLRKRSYGKNKLYYLWIKSRAPLAEMPMSRGDRLAQSVNKYLLNLFKRNVNEQSYCFLSSIFLGRRELLGEEKQILASAGVSHLLAISGLHIGLTAFVLFFIFGFFNISFKARLIISMIFLYFYTMLTGISASTLRAVIMYSVFALSFFMERRVNLFNSLGIAGIISLLINPLSLFSVGFQLSFFSVFAIVLGMKIFSIRESTNLFLNYVKQLFFVSLFVAIFIAPLVSYYFDRIYFLSIFYNVILIPFFTLILVVNFIFIILSPFSFIAQSIGSVLSLLIPLFINFTRFLGAIKFSCINYSFSFKLMWFYYLSLAMILMIYRFSKKKVLKRNNQDLV
jgi:ComEC/Rec2-related protein